MLISRHFLLLSLLLVSSVAVTHAPDLPLTGFYSAVNYPSISPAHPGPVGVTIPIGRLNQPRPDRFQFINQVALDGNADSVVGVFHPKILRAAVIQQPNNSPGYVSSKEGVLTQFRMADRFGVTALLAHNYLAGQAFFKIETGDILTIVYGNGNTLAYRVNEIQQYQALSPNSPYSKFVDLAHPDQRVMTATDLFNKIYTNRGSLVLQTCIENNGDLSWGRLFILATPINPDDPQPGRDEPPLYQ